MAEPDARASTTVDELLRQISAKLTANRPLIGRSLSWGHMTWRQERSGEFTIDLDIRL